VGRVLVDTLVIGENMRTAIFFASINISTMLARIAKGDGVVIAPIEPEFLASVYFVLLVIFIVMDIVDFFRWKR
jgi:hypothetical protein